MSARVRVRRQIEARFRGYVELDVGSLFSDAAPSALAAAHQHQNTVLHRRCPLDWDTVFFNPGGTSGSHSAYVQARAAWLGAHLAGEDTAPLEDACVRQLAAFWREWAGYQVTAQDDGLTALG